MSAQRRTVFAGVPWTERGFLAETLRQETVGGGLLLLGAALGLIYANVDLSGYDHLKHIHLGPAALHLNLSLADWAADGLLAIFFFVAGLELKRELVVGSLSKPAQAVLPVVAALAGMVVPALLYLAVTAGNADAAQGWGIPMATDIAFALAVLAVAGSHLPTPLRVFLLTLAVVDDLGAISVIAIFYTDAVKFAPLGASVLVFALWWWLQHRRVRAWWIYVPLAVLAWALVHDSGVHATVAGVALGLLMRVRPDPGEERSPAESVEHHLRPVSAGIAVPIFAFFAAGTPISADALRAMVHDPAAIGVIVGLVIGKFVGVFGGTWLTARFTRAELNEQLSWTDMAGLAFLSGIGFTVSLLIAELAFEGEPTRLDAVKEAVLVGSVVAAVVAMVILRLRDRTYRRFAEALDAGDEEAEPSAA
jgi:Na+:H+ antiporter, NhaA family